MDGVEREGESIAFKKKGRRSISKNGGSGSDVGNEPREEGWDERRRGVGPGTEWFRWLLISRGSDFFLFMYLS